MAGAMKMNEAGFGVEPKEKGPRQKQRSGTRLPIGNQTPQEPPYPIETLSPSTITGTFLTPCE
jgi:hypothetical protein